MIRRPPRSTRTDTLFPYTTLFRSELDFAVIGHLTDTGRMVLRFNGEQVGDLPIDPLAAASPEYDRPWVKTPPQKPLGRVNHPLPFIEEIGRASCRERVCQYV